MRTYLSSIVVLAGCLVACGGKVPPEEFSNGSDTGTSDTSTQADSASDSSSEREMRPDSPPPSKATCTKMVAAMCSDKASACCTTAGFTWNGDGCNTNIDYYCNSLVDQVTLGRATYDESYLDACLAGWQANLTACEVDGLTSAKNQIPCTHLFNGTKKVGDTCSGKAFVECEAPAGFGAYCDVRTGETTGKCRAYGFVGKDQACNFYGSTVRYCDTGLYCDLTSTTPTCKTAKTLGATCDGPDDFSCGIGASCNMNKCTALAGEGATCTRNEECASYSCVSSKCTKPDNAIVSAWLCGGGM
jgi:hypothetical protein